MSELQVEATGETVGEAKWSALRELEKQQPGLDKGSVRFQVVSEGERGLLGVGYAPARVIATVLAEAQAAPAEPRDESELAAEVRALVERIVYAIGVTGRVEVDEDEETITASCTGPDLGMLIGRHGQTIDAIQLLSYQAAFRGRQDRKRVTVDAAGYRRRQGESLRRRADLAAEDALSHGEAVEMDPMGSNERRVVHEHLRDRPEIETYSEGDEPNRYVVVAPLVSD
jgi:spoIIIJ-associated protein